MFRRYCIKIHPKRIYLSASSLLIAFIFVLVLHIVLGFLLLHTKIFPARSHLILCRNLVLPADGTPFAAVTALRVRFVLARQNNNWKIFLLLVHVLLALVRRHNVLADRFHELVILSHLLQGLPDTLEDKQIWEAWTQPKELLQIEMLRRLLPNTPLL